jgi:hypothetical protein
MTCITAVILSVCAFKYVSAQMLPEGQEETDVEVFNSVENFGVTCSVFGCTL